MVQAGQEADPNTYAPLCRMYKPAAHLFRDRLPTITILGETCRDNNSTFRPILPKWDEFQHQ